jgi:hypothetical protein
MNDPCHSRAVNTELHRISRERCHLPRAKCMKLRSGVCSTPTRFRHFKPAWLLKIYSCGLRSEPSERLQVLPPEEPFLRAGLLLHEVATVLGRCLPVRL